jgi:hypothetical protein
MSINTSTVSDVTIVEGKLFEKTTRNSSSNADTHPDSNEGTITLLLHHALPSVYPHKYMSDVTIVRQQHTKSTRNSSLNADNYDFLDINQIRSNALLADIH